MFINSVPPSSLGRVRHSGSLTAAYTDFQSPRFLILPTHPTFTVAMSPLPDVFWGPCSMFLVDATSADTKV